MKRFYKLVSISEAGEGFGILLDGRAVKTQSGAELRVAHKAIAEYLMAEWAAQEVEIIPDSMPFTQFVNTLIDRVVVERTAMSAYVLKYLDTDLVCYLASEPKELVEKQEEYWKPVRDWFAKKFDCELKTTSGLAALSQDKKTHQVIKDYVESLDDERFTLLQIVTSACGSLILALALLEKAVSAEHMMRASFVEENFKEELYNAEKYGSDPLTEKKKRVTELDLKTAEQYIACL